MPASIDRLSPIEQGALLLKQLEDAEAREQIRIYDNPGAGGGPYPWQVLFHNAGADHAERCLMAGNRTGKTRSMAAECALHLTGEYPRWWKGRRFHTPVRCWVGSETNEGSRDIVQAALLGDPVGTGWIPARAIHEKDPSYRQVGLSGVADSCRVQHRTGGWSKVTFKTYKQGREAWQGTSQHFVWCDEEPPMDIFTEALTRTIDVKGVMVLTFTPMEGISDAVRHFMDGGRGIYLQSATWDEVDHLDKDEQDRLWNSYPEHERATRASGKPMMGTGAVFPLADEDVICDPFEIPGYFRRIAGVDFGIDHPAAAVWIALDPDSDVIYTYDSYKAPNQTSVYHAKALIARGKWIPVAWPHDGLKRGMADGMPIMQQYMDNGANMMGGSARYDDKTGGNQPLEPGIIDMLERMRTGRLKVFSNQHELLDEKRFYHRKDGKIVQIKDDLMSAWRYAIMMLRYAMTESDTMVRPATTRRRRDYNPLSY
jgi:phage terminase large subunit-like protein